MPNKVKGDKKRRSGSGRGARPASAPMHSVKALLERRNPIFSESFAHQSRQDAWQQRLEKILPNGLAARINQVLARGDELIVYAESAVWAARLRFALAEAESAVRADHPEIAAISVRVLPRKPAASGSGDGGGSSRKV